MCNMLANCFMYNKIFLTKNKKYETQTLQHKNKNEYKYESLSQSEYDTECWICYCLDKDIKIMCKCPYRKVHIKCLNKWKLINQGKKEETHCRFCNSEYL